VTQHNRPQSGWKPYVDKEMHLGTGLHAWYCFFPSLSPLLRKEKWVSDVNQIQSEGAEEKKL
jgi:hypothetical protein